MRRKIWRWVIVMSVVIAALAIPRAARTSAAQQEGPQQSAPAQQTEPVKPPSGTPPPGQKPPQAEQNAPQVAISVQANLVNVDTIVTDQEGNLVTGLKRENFRVLDNGDRQQITNFAPTDAPITVVMLVEFSNISGGYFGYKARDWAGAFLGMLKPQDWVALKIYDLNTRIVTDFTQDKGEVAQAIQGLFFPNFSEANMFDAVLETLDQLRDVRGKKSILLLSTGFDTLSKHNLDQTLVRLKETEVTIFCVGMAEELDLMPTGNSDIVYMQAKNQLMSFARITGGYAYFPRFPAEMPDIFNTIANYLRSQYSLVFSPSTPQDGKYHKLVVQVVDDQGNPLEVVNNKGKMKKVVVTARQGYTAPNAPAGN